MTTAGGVSNIDQVPNAALPVSYVDPRNSLPAPIAYSENSVPVGGIVNFRYSTPTTSPVVLSIYRLGWDIVGGTKDWLEAEYTVPGAMESVGPGSYIHVEKALSSGAVLSAMTLECWVRPFLGVPEWRGLITQYAFNDSCGFGLFLTDAGAVACYFGDGYIRSDGALMQANAQGVNWTPLSSGSYIGSPGIFAWVSSNAP
jgi:hypothetical protein